MRIDHLVLEYLDDMYYLGGTGHRFEDAVDMVRDIGMYARFGRGVQVTQDTLKDIATLVSRIN